MVFGVSQVTAFFEDSGQMGLSHCTCMHLQSEGIVRPKYMIDFNMPAYWKQIIENYKRPARIPYPNNAGQTIVHEDVQFPARSLMRLIVSAVAVEYY